MTGGRELSAPPGPALPSTPQLATISRGRELASTSSQAQVHSTLLASELFLRSLLTPDVCVLLTPIPPGSSTHELGIRSLRGERAEGDRALEKPRDAAGSQALGGAP